jgi:hypothetical protein
VSARLTAQDRADREVTEAALQLRIVETAAWLGWHSAHWRALQNRRGIWQVPVEGGLGKGWPDLTLLHPDRRRIIFAELKRQEKPLEPDQERVLGMLRQLVGPREVGGIVVPTVEVYVWRPSDIRDPIEESTVFAILRSRP